MAARKRVAQKLIMGLPERFWAKTRIEDAGYETPCLIWTGYVLPSGYGWFGWIDGSRGAHRVSYLAQVGPIPAGLVIDHLCRNRACVNVAHLELVTNRENVLRGETIVAAHAAKTHCPYGHPYSHSDQDGRRCATCIQARSERRNERRRAERASKPPKAPRTHCKHGHLLDETNTYVDPDGSIGCRTCRSAASRRCYQRKVAAKGQTDER